MPIIPTTRYTGLSPLPGGRPLIVAASGGGGTTVGRTRYFQIPALGTGIAIANSTTPTIFYRSAKWLPVDLMPGSTFFFEVIYYNTSSGAHGQVELLGPDLSVIETLDLASTGGSTFDKWTRKRVTVGKSYSATGTYKLRLTGVVSGTVAILDYRFYVEQTNPTLTVECYPLLVGTNASFFDLSGISGADLFRTTSLTYAPTMQHDGAYPAGVYDEVDQVKHNLAWFKYAASQHPSLQYCYLESACDGFSDHSWIQLYGVDPGSSVQNAVTGSDIAQDNSVTPFVDPVRSGNFTLPNDGYYSLRMKSQWTGMAANAFFYSGWLNIVSEASAGALSGRTYWIIGNGETPAQRRSKPTFVTGFAKKFLIADFQHPSLTKNYALDDGTNDSGGSGSEIAASDIATNAAYVKGVFESSSDLDGVLTAGDRFNGNNNGSNTIVSFIAEDYAVGATDMCPGVGIGSSKVEVFKAARLRVEVFKSPGV